MRVRIVGCTGSMSGPRAAASCYLVQAEGMDLSTGRVRTWNVVLDLGPGSFGQLWRHVDPCDLDAVVFSHCHADHMGDVISLHVHRRWGPGRGHGRIVVAGPQGVLDRVRQVDGVGEEEDYSAEFDIRTLHAGEPLVVGPLTLTPSTAWHTVPAFGLRVEGPADALAGAGAGDGAGADDNARAVLFYTGDTDICDTIVEGARGADLLLSEAGFTRDDQPRGIHMTGERVAEVATRAAVDRVVVTHIQPWTDPQVVVDEVRSTWDGALDVASAGQLHTL